MAITKGGLLNDPDALSYEATSGSYGGTAELFIDYTTKKIRLIRVGNLSADGVTLKCVYSKLKLIWKSDATLIKYPFPMTPITDEQFELVNGWDFDKTYVSTTAITVASCSGSTGTSTITTSGSFTTSKIVPGMYLSGTNVGTGAKVLSVDTASQITVSVQNAGNISAATLTFWTDSDYTYNLIRTGGWALKDTGGTTQEEWAGVISLGSLGAQASTITLTSGATTLNNAVLTVASTTGVIAGSYLIAAGVPSGTKVVSVDNSTTITMSQQATATLTDLIVTVKPKDQVYYQNNASGTAVNFGLTGPVNQAVKTYGDASHGNFDNRSYMKIFVREQGYTYSISKLTDIGVSTMTYQVYRFPLGNAQDLKITHTDNDISGTAPYTTMNITWYAAPQSRTIGGNARNFSVVIDADTSAAPGVSGSATAEQIYEYVQYQLRQNTDIDNGSGTKNGQVTRDLVKFVGDTLYTLYDSSDGGVYIDNFNASDTNRIVFVDDTNTNRTYPYTAAGSIAFNSYLVQDGANAKYALFFSQLSGAKKFGTSLAAIVKKADNTTDITGTVTGASITYDFDYDGNTQAAWTPATTYVIGDEYRNGTTWYRVTTGYTSGGSFGATDTTNSIVIPGPSVVVVGSGLNYAQYVSTSGTIAKSISNNFSLVSALERNYANPA